MNTDARAQFRDFVIKNGPTLQGGAVNAVKISRLPFSYLEDVRQEGLVTTWKEYPSRLILCEDITVAAFACKSMYHHAANQGRRHENSHTERREHEELTRLDKRTHEPDFARIVMTGDALDLVAEALRSLPERERRIVELSILNIPQEAIAAALGITQQSQVSKKLKKARGLMMQAVGEATLNELLGDGVA